MTPEDRATPFGTNPKGFSYWKEDETFFIDDDPMQRPIGEFEKEDHAILFVNAPECLSIIRALITATTPREHNEALVRAHAMLAKMGVEE